MAEKDASRWDNLPGAMRGVLPAGTALRGYELISILGQGAFGITYRARDLQLHREVAVKEYLPTSLALREGRTTVVPRSAEHAEQFAWGRERFMDEARTLARLDRTPAIVRVHDFLEDNGTAYMVMALIEGETLGRRLAREQRLSPDAVERIVFPLLDGLEEVHGIGFLHRDIKPANIMIDEHGRPTLIDFGASRAAMAERSTTLTAIFTPGYAAAEQFTSAKLGPWTDIYGLAATLYHVITGSIPPSAIERILKDTYEPLSTLQPDGFPPGLLAGIDAGLAIRVEDRPKTIAEWRQMLRADGYGASALEATRIGRRPGRLARAAGRTRKARLTLKGPALWGAAAAAILMIMGGSYLAMTSVSPGTSVASLSAEQLEQALAERRKADTLAAEKRRLEDEARQKAQADAETKRQADAELDQARQARLKAEQELAELRARLEARRQESTPRDQDALTAQRAVEEAAQRKAEGEAAALREAEEEAEKKAAAETEAKRQADKALAEAEAQRKHAEADARVKAGVESTARAQASEEEQRKAEQDAAARRQTDEAAAKAQAERDKAEAEARIKAEAKAETDKAAAVLARQKEEGEAGEKALRLEPADRQRLQVALTSLGFDTRGNDGLFGPRTREMIASWQKARKDPPTGFLTAAQQQTLVKDAAAALAKYDEQKKAEEEAKARSVAATASPGTTDGLWRGTFDCRNSSRHPPFTLDLETRLSNGSGTWYAPNTSSANGETTSVQVSVNGPDDVTVVRGSIGGRSSSDTPLSGRFDGNTIRASNGSCTLALSRGGGGAPAPTTASPLPDGTYTGALHLDSLVMRFSVQFKNGVGTGTVSRTGCGSASVSLRVGLSGDVTGDGRLFPPTCASLPIPITGRVNGSRLLLGVVTALGGGGDRRREFVLAQGGADAPDTTLSTGLAQSDIAAASPPAPRGGPASAAVRSPDGLWRGSYACGPSLGIGRTEAFDVSLELRLIGGSGTWRSDSPARNGGTIEIRVSIDGTAASSERFQTTGAGSYGASGMSTPAKLSGRYDANTIRTEGRESTTGNRQCALSLSRH